jgi:hypothetical protein
MKANFLPVRRQPLCARFQTASAIAPRNPAAIQFFVVRFSIPHWLEEELSLSVHFKPVLDRR